MNNSWTPVIYYIILGGLMGYIFARFILETQKIMEDIIPIVMMGMMFGPIVFIGVIFVFFLYAVIKGLDLFFGILRKGVKSLKIF